VSKKVRVGTGQYFDKVEGFATWKKKRIGINLIPVTVIASENIFTDTCGKSSRAPTLICLPCFALLACGKVGFWD
jgi:hypothetical protein